MVLRDSLFKHIRDLGSCDGMKQLSPEGVPLLATMRRLDSATPPPKPSSYERDFLDLLGKRLWGEGPSSELADCSLQPRSGSPFHAHRLVLQARCPYLASMVAATSAQSPSTQLDCEREELLSVLRHLYADELPTQVDAAALLRLRSVAQEFALPALDDAVSSVLAQQLIPSLCCDLLREIGREEARARLAHSAAAPTCAALRRACSEYAAQCPSEMFECEAFQHLPAAQQVWLFATCFEGRELHVFAEGLPAALTSSAEELLHALLAPPFSCAIDGLPMAQPGGAIAAVTPLQTALTKHNWRGATLLLDAGASPQPTNATGGRTLLHVAAEAGDAQVCTYLAQRGSAPVNAVDADGYSPLDLAVLHEHASATTALRERGALSRYSKEGDSLLHHLATSGRAVSLRLLLSADNVDAPNEAGLTPLHLATFAGQSESARPLLEARADLHKMASGGGARFGGRVLGNALHLACRRGEEALVLLLLEHGANVASKVSATGEAALHLAAPYPPVARLLLLGGAGVEPREGAGPTPLQHAVVAPTAALECCRILLDAGARSNTADFVLKQTPLHRLCDQPVGVEEDYKALEVLFLLHRHGAGLNAQDKHGNTPIMYAAFKGHDLLALALVAGGASPNVPNNDGICALSSLPPKQEALRGARAVSRELRGSMLARIAQPLPWLPDHMMDHCQVCVDPFSASNRRHHCRHCGRIVCATCSEHKLAIPKFGLMKPERVCIECRPILEAYGDRPLGPPSTGAALLAAQHAVQVEREAVQHNVVDHLESQLRKTAGVTTGAEPPWPKTPSSSAALPPAALPTPPLDDNPFGPSASPADANPFGTAAAPDLAHAFGGAGGPGMLSRRNNAKNANPFSAEDLQPSGVLPFDGGAVANPFDEEAEQVATLMKNPFDSDGELVGPQRERRR